MKTKNKKPTYECDKCGACCIHFNVNIYPEDLKREPRLKRIPLVVTDDGRQFLNDSSKSGCSLLTKSNLCFIYETRPKVCRGFEVGSRHCQWARGRSGLPMLDPIEK